MQETWIQSISTFFQGLRLVMQSVWWILPMWRSRGCGPSKLARIINVRSFGIQHKSLAIHLALDIPSCYRGENVWGFLTDTRGILECNLSRWHHSICFYRRKFVPRVLLILTSLVFGLADACVLCQCALEVTSNQRKFHGNSSNTILATLCEFAGELRTPSSSLYTLANYHFIFITPTSLILAMLHISITAMNCVMQTSYVFSPRAIWLALPIFSSDLSKVTRYSFIS